MKAICNHCESLQEYTLKDIELTTSYYEKSTIEVGICDNCNKVVCFPHSSTPQIKEALNMTEDTLTRLKEERNQLNDKINKLGVFIYEEGSIFSSLHEIDQHDLVNQLFVMKNYQEILDKRLWRAHNS